jgi:glycosyltransferase involved in cell wall biosynthesis
MGWLSGKANSASSEDITISIELQSAFSLKCKARGSEVVQMVDSVDQKTASASNKVHVNAKPLVSIIMPSFQQGRYIEEAITSILNQDYNNTELIICDGGSNDETIDVLHKYQSSIAHFESEIDNGQSHALNKAIGYASGSIIGWLNSDDRYTPGAISAAVSVFLANPDVRVVHGNRILINEKSEVCGWSIPLSFNPSLRPFNVCSETAFWRAEAMTTIFNEQLNFAMDQDFFCRMWSPGTFHYLNRFQGAFRCHSASKSSTIWESEGMAEADMIWREIFGLSRPPNRIRLPKLVEAVALFRYPRQIGLPYLKYRITRLLSSQSATSQ